MRCLKILFLALWLIAPGTAVAEELDTSGTIWDGAEELQLDEVDIDDNHFCGTGPWRSKACEHYYGGTCCFCKAATDMKPSKKPGMMDFLVDGEWVTLPQSVRKPPDPHRPTTGIVVCDPGGQFECWISNLGV